jgi:hypothetical protein
MKSRGFAVCLIRVSSLWAQHLCSSPNRQRRRRRPAAHAPVSAVLEGGGAPGLAQASRNQVAGENRARWTPARHQHGRLSRNHASENRPISSPL